VRRVGAGRRGGLHELPSMLSWILSLAPVRRDAAEGVRVQGVHRGRVSRRVLPRPVRRGRGWSLPALRKLLKWAVQQRLWGGRDWKLHQLQRVWNWVERVQGLLGPGRQGLQGRAVQRECVVWGAVLQLSRDEHACMQLEVDGRDGWRQLSVCHLSDKWDLPGMPCRLDSVRGILCGVQAREVV